MTEATVKDSQPTQHMSEFGRTLYSLMLTRGIEHKQTLLEILKENGCYSISQARLSYYFNGQRSVDPKFFAYVSELLRLGSGERRQLAWSFAYGQFQPNAEEEAEMRELRRRL